MKIRTAISLVLCSICGCSIDKGASGPPLTAVVGPVRLAPLAVSDSVSAEEAALIEEIVGYVPEVSREVFREALRRGRAIVHLDDPRGEFLVDSLEHLRGRTAPRTSGGRVDERTSRPVSGLVPATIALVQSLPVEGARVVVLRRATQRPSDVILVTDDTENRDLRNALGALFKARKRDGVLPTKDVQVSIYATQSSAGGHSTNATSIIDWDGLRSAPIEELSGVGPARTVVVQLKSSSDRTH